MSKSKAFADDMCLKSQSLLLEKLRKKENIVGTGEKDNDQHLFPFSYNVFWSIVLKGHWNYGLGLAISD